MRIIVAGSEGLIGKEICSSLIDSGHKVIKADLLLGDDFTNETYVKNFFKQHKARALVNLFALNHHIDNTNLNNNLFDISLESFEKFLKINVASLFLVCREFARNNKKSSIVNFSSTYGVVSPRLDIYEDDQKHIGYSVSKGAVLMLSKHLATHLAPYCRVNTIIPGGVRHEQPQSFKRKYAKHTPLKRMMDVKEIYGAVEFLISSRASYVTGAELKVDGGWTLW